MKELNLLRDMTTNQAIGTYGKLKGKYDINPR